MAKAYSIDLRERVVAFVGGGPSCHEAAAHFRVSVSFVVKLMQAWWKNGHVRPRPAGGRRHAKLEAHRALLLERVEAQSDITMPELAAELQSITGVSAAPATLSRWLRRNGYRFKKNAAGQRARSSRCPAGPPRMARQTSAPDAARGPSPGLHR